MEHIQVDLSHLPLADSHGIFPLPLFRYDSQLFPSLPFEAGKKDAVLGSGIVLMTQLASLLALICFWWTLCWAEGSASHRRECGLLLFSLYELGQKSEFVYFHLST